MKLGKLQVLALASFMLFTNTIYATINNIKVSGVHKAISSSIIASEYDNSTVQESVSYNQTLTDTDGDGYFPCMISFEVTRGSFSFKNSGKSRVDVTLYSSATGHAIWSARVNSGNSVTSASKLSLAAGKYYFIVVSDDGSALNITCSARWL